MHNVQSPRLDDATVEAQIKAKGLDVAPRVTKEQIDALMARVQYIGGRVGESTSTVVHAFLDGTFLLASGHSACVSAENFNAELGFNMARGQAEVKARDQLWALEGYALRSKLAAVPADFRDRVRLERDSRADELAKLRAFIDGPRFASVPEEEQDRMREQRDVMSDLVAVLSSRIAAFPA